MTCTRRRIPRKDAAARVSSGDGTLDADDLDLLAQGMIDADDAFDLNDDGVVDLVDRTFWVTVLAQSAVGDSNLDGRFDSADLVEVFIAGLYESGQPAGWAQGDWNGDLLFDSRDFVLAFQADQYTEGP